MRSDRQIHLDEHEYRQDTHRVIPLRRKSDHSPSQHYTPDSRRDYRPLLMLGIVSAVAVLGAVFIVIGGLG